MPTHNKTNLTVPEHIKELCDLSHEATCVIDSEGNFIYANKHIEYFYQMDTKALLHTHVLKNPIRSKFLADESLLSTGTVGLDAIHYKRPIHNFGLYDKTHAVMLNAFPYFDFLSKEIYVFIQHTNLDPLQQKLLENYREALRNGVDFSNEGIAGFPSSIIAIDSAMKELLHMLKKAALRDSNVLLLGETGVGKEVLARGIHAVSKRCDGPFIPVNCGSIPSELFESEFFGYEKGAFTSAAQTKPGYFELANSGTIFLDELGELPLNFQVKLLRVLENRECRRLGARKSIKLDFRVVAATNKKLMDEVQSGKFRSDLYYRLNVISVIIPPLRERKKDIIPLANSFIEYFNHKENLNKRLSREAAKYLEQYDWPGNIRELRNTIERSVAFVTGDIIEKEDLNISKDIKTNDSGGGSLASLVGDYETRIIQERINQLGSIRKAAKSLGVSHATLLRKLGKSKTLPHEN